MRYLTSSLAAAALLVLAGCDQAKEEATTEEVVEPISATEEEAATEGMIEEAGALIEEQTGDALNELETAAGGLMEQAEEAAEEATEATEEAEEAAEKAKKEGGE